MFKRKLKWVKRWWTEREITEGFSVFRPESKNAFIPNTDKPTLWCRLFHRRFHWTNRPFWEKTVRYSYEIVCSRCGQCWEVAFKRKKDE